LFFGVLVLVLMSYKLAVICLGFYKVISTKLLFWNSQDRSNNENWIGNQVKYNQDFSLVWWFLFFWIFLFVFEQQNSNLSKPFWKYSNFSVQHIWLGDAFYIILWKTRVRSFWTILKLQLTQKRSWKRTRWSAADRPRSYWPETRIYFRSHLVISPSRRISVK
jgi:hypothetical protein